MTAIPSTSPALHCYELRSKARSTLNRDLTRYLPKSLGSSRQNLRDVDFGWQLFERETAQVDLA